ncbi:hypothetical protein NDU88_001996 [Pleurodeles waltl]|uniref:Uncharacterized protein n=1 Tax=Pleurodeles waltl TaxID=8319 RepID=A0AAV7M227_PLEWA|nr:hypothetical protein NDU88_001996 [Pleurodeles waltl]
MPLWVLGAAGVTEVTGGWGRALRHGGNGRQYCVTHLPRPAWPKDGWFCVGHAGSRRPRKVIQRLAGAPRFPPLPGKGRAASGGRKQGIDPAAAGTQQWCGAVSAWHCDGRLHVIHPGASRLWARDAP